LIPLSGFELESGRHALDGFLLATSERDAHPDEESDGHLGGLDVYILKIDSNQPSEAVLRKIDQLVKREKIHFFTGLIPTELKQTVRDQLSGTEVILLEIEIESSQNETTMSVDSFSDAFSRNFGYPPMQPAHLAYRLARLIDRVVRSIDGDFTNRDRVKAAFEGVQTE